MTICTVIAIFAPMPEHREAIKKTLLEQAEIVRTEPGCEYYDLYDDVNGDLVFVEAWTTRELWQIHNGAETVAAIRAAIAGKLTCDLEVRELYKIPGQN
jgi:quinol monooxygenase YgiN